MWNRSTLAKYLVVQVATLVLVVAALIVADQVVSVPIWLVVTILVLWIGKDIVLYLKVWRSYTVGENSPTKDLIGLEATVIYSLDPTGYVRVRGELWKAELRAPDHPALSGDATKVVGIKGTTLIVERSEDVS
jgi:membrane protein implicated in regulation of membrane protease activity